MPRFPLAAGGEVMGFVDLLLLGALWDAKLVLKHCFWTLRLPHLWCFFRFWVDLLTPYRLGGSLPLSFRGSLLYLGAVFFIWMASLIS